MVTRHHPDNYFVLDFVTTSGTATYQSDLVTGATRTRNWRQPMTSPDIDDGTTYNAMTDDFDSKRHLKGPTSMSIYLTPGRHYRSKYKLIIQDCYRRRNQRSEERKTPLMSLKNCYGTTHLPTLSNRLTEEWKLKYFQNLLREVIEFYQSLPITTETTMNDVLTEFQNAFNQDDLKEVARYKWNPARNKPTAETFLDFLKRLKVIARKAFRNNTGQKKPLLSLRQAPDLCLAGHIE